MIKSNLYILSRMEGEIKFKIGFALDRRELQ